MICKETTIEPDTPMKLRPRPADLPDFARPPVNEVVLSIQFAPLTGLTGAHVGLFWQKIRDQYPGVSEKAPLPPVFEIFGGVPSAPPVQIRVSASPQTPRFWFEAADGKDLVQVQQDRIIHNWRRLQAQQDYPRYEAIRERFASNVKAFMAFAAAEGVGELRPNQCEVTYINAIELPEGNNPHGLLDRITPWWTGRFSEAFSLEFENTALQSRFVLRRGGEPYGRAYVAFMPAFLPPRNRPIVRLEITVRGKPRDNTLEEAFHLLDDGREIVVRTFAAVTTPAMWEIWGRTDAQ